MDLRTDRTRGDIIFCLLVSFRLDFTATLNSWISGFTSAGNNTILMQAVENDVVRQSNRER